MAAKIPYQTSVFQTGDVALRGATADLPLHDNVVKRVSVALRDSRQQPFLALVQGPINGDIDVTNNAVEGAALSA